MICRNETAICSEITVKRMEMIRIADVYGMTAEKTIRCSQELDGLINEYLQLQYHSDFLLSKFESYDFNTEVNA
ncbi:Spo0E family sporulation regulatory protein-aspartic acid phosphatase [Actinomycetes bacterium NPDC127524]|jgi:hypothetical protein|uniref:Spo0E family sporulation regulatory protein-aspartic acid phosphatase n=1 Tax=Peribacillus sp. B-H-3 TaxID=3400420 RepID=UPI003645F576